MHFFGLFPRYHSLPFEKIWQNCSYKIKIGSGISFLAYIPWRHLFIAVLVKSMQGENLMRSNDTKEE